MVWQLLILIAILPSLIYSRAPDGFFNPYKNRIFIETGSWEGHGIANALQAGFEEIHSIEISQLYYHECSERFTGNPKIHLWLGDSGKLLGEVIQNINEPVTFWLDGHFSGALTGKGETNTPILAELEAIRNHPIKTHTIIIDDVRLFGSEEFDLISLETILQKIYDINPLYRVTYEEGYIPGDILVAKVEGY